MKKSDCKIPITGRLEEEVSVFETMRSYKGKILALNEHIERLKESANTLGVLKVPDGNVVRSDIEAKISAYKSKDILIRPTLYKSGIIYLILPMSKIDDKLYKNGVQVATAVNQLPAINAAPVGAKSNFYGPQALSYLTHSKENFEILYLDSNGFVGELRINNIFMIKKEVIKTAPAIHILNGVTRRIVLDLAKSIAFETEETYLTRHDLYNADECFLTNSVLEVMPVVKLDGRVIGTGKPGPITKNLRQLYQKAVKNI